MGDQYNNTLMMKIGGAVITLLVVGTVTAMVTTISTVDRLEPQIEQLQQNDELQSQWIAEWPSTGELAADVRQTKDIEDLYREMEESNQAIVEIRARLREIELEQAREDG